MLTLSEIAPIFARLDGNEDETAAVEKSLRNFVQRFPLPPTSREGRVFLYDNPAVVALRLGYVAHRFGLNRVLLHPYTQFLHQRAQEAIRRCEAGEDFAFHAVARPIGDDFWASWDEPAADSSDDQCRAERARWLMRRKGIELGRFSQGGGLVAQILPLLRKG